MPDHWVEEVFAEGTANEPVAGVRHEDAVAFCTWLTTESADGHRYRLPTVDELDAIVAGETSPASYWGLNSLGGRGDRLTQEHTRSRHVGAVRHNCGMTAVTSPHVVWVTCR